MMQKVTQYTIVQDDSVHYYVLLEQTVIAAIDCFDPMGGPGSYGWKVNRAALEGTAPSLQTALAFVILAFSGWTDEITTIKPREYYVRPHNAGDTSDAKNVAKQLARLLNLLSFFNRHNINTGHGTLSSDASTWKHKIIKMLKAEGWLVSIPHDDYIVQTPPNRDPHDWTLRSTMEDK